MGAFLGDAWKDFYHDLDKTCKEKVKKLRGKCMKLMREEAVKVIA